MVHHNSGERTAYSRQQQQVKLHCRSKPAACALPARHAAPTPTLRRAPPTTAPARCTWRASPRTAGCRMCWPPCTQQRNLQLVITDQRRSQQAPACRRRVVSFHHFHRCDSGPGPTAEKNLPAFSGSSLTDLLTAPAKASTSAATSLSGSICPQWNPVTPSCSAKATCLKIQTMPCSKLKSGHGAWDPCWWVQSSARVVRTLTVSIRPPVEETTGTVPYCIACIWIRPHLQSHRRNSERVGGETCRQAFTPSHDPRCWTPRLMLPDTDLHTLGIG